MTYAHDAHCNTIHEAGPDPCPPAREPDAVGVREIGAHLAGAGFADRDQFKWLLKDTNPKDEVDEILANAYSDAVIVHPGDTLVIRVPRDTTRMQVEHMIATIRERYLERDLGLLFVAAEQILVYRPVGAP